MGYWTSLTEGSSWSRACFKSKKPETNSNLKLLMMQNLSTDPLWCLTACSAIGVKEHIAELRLSTAPYHSIAPKILWDAKFGISSAFSCHGKRGSSPLSVWHWLHVFGLGRSANSRTHLSALQSNQMLQPWLEPSVRASQAGGAQVWPLWVVVDWCT